MAYMEAKNKVTYDILILLQPTSPIRRSSHIDQAIDLLWKSDLDSVVSVKGPFKKRDPILKAVRDGVLEDYIPVTDPAAVEPIFMYNASIYAVKRDFFIKNRKLISPKQVPLVMDTIHSVDVDTEADFLVAETYLKFLAKQPA